MASEDGLREKIGRKLTKRRKDPKRVSLDIPERFKDGDDAQDDVTAPKSKEALAMNQSIFSMIAKVGQQPQTDLRTMHEVDSGESDEEGGGEPHYHSLDGAARLSKLSTANDWEPSVVKDEASKGKETKHRRALSEHRLLKSLPKLSIKNRKDSKRQSLTGGTMTSSQILPPRPTEDDSTSTSPDEFTQQRRSKTKISEPDSEKALPVSRRSRHGSTASRTKGPITLAQRLKEIFEFETTEEVISEYPCWLLQSILLQGYMYITQRHICFYAYIPKKNHEVSKTGYLSKRGRSKYNRYWFILKGDVLAYYISPAELYFPRNLINLQYAVSASVMEVKDKGKDETAFSVTTDERTYLFKADSAASAKEWVRSIQRVIFRAHNDGNSVKISLPMQNVLDIEESTILDFADTVKIRVIDNDETFAVDDYFFSFFSHGQDALNVLRIMVNDNDNCEPSPKRPDQAAKIITPIRRSMSDETRRISSQHSPAGTPPLRENVRATLSPLPAVNIGRSSSRVSTDSKRSSTDLNRRSFDVRRSMDASRTFRQLSQEVRRSVSLNRNDTHLRNRPGDKSPLSAKPQDSSDSATNSLDPGTESSAAVQSMDDSNASASQILRRSDVFRGPTIHHSTASASEPSIDILARQSQDTTRSFGALKTPQKSPRMFHQKEGHNQAGEKSTPPGPADMEDENETQQPAGRLSGSSSALQDLMGAASYPLQKASGIAGFIRTRSKKMSNLLATESMGYYEKVSGMWAGGRKHYNTEEGLEPNDQVHGIEEDEDAAKAAEHFREHFALPESEQLQSSFFCSLQRVLPTYGKIYISNHFFCFRSLMIGSRTKIIIPLKDIENVNKETGFRIRTHGLAVVIRGHEELFFEFSRVEYRNECTVTLLRILESTRYMEEASSTNSEEDADDENAKAEHDMLQAARNGVEARTFLDKSQILRDTEHGRIPLIFDDPLASIVDFKPAESLKIVCLTIGSRGDVQPYIALCKALIEEGHQPRIATHAEFEPWIRRHGIDFAPVDGNPAELMRICVEHGMFTYSFMKEANSKFRGWLDAVCSSAWKACQGADLLIESPSAMAGIHIAEALEIPYFRAFTMPWTRTRAYPHAFAVGEHKMGGGYNSLTYITFDTIFWTAIASQVNRWRRRELGLPNTSLNKMQQNSRPFLYNFSPSVVVPPLDWPDWIRVTGYWFLDESNGWEPPADLVEFIRKARTDGKKLVYVGFGSIVIDDPAALTKTVVDSVLKADVRCILSKGWSDRLGTKDASKPEFPLPPDIFQIQSAPHSWLFKQLDAAVHHGGSGTTGASLRAGLPTIIKPFFGDQFFYGQRVEDLGVGICLKKVNTSVLGRALWEATNSQRIIIKAKILGEKIRKEHGVEVAIQTIYRELDRAKSLVKKREKRNDAANEFEEDWTFIDDEEELEMAPQVAGWQSLKHIQNAPLDGRAGSSALALGSMVLKGASTVQGDAEYREE
ncbi:glycosyltransferase family 1 protein [Lepidopterella palustris CBS 459.81]|uniref:Sterol 3-beta-glucosyltransferase n=1 Tax=Lepidopterella palustris CBS 459.81 TaxID=1314670 RepID=A0A8E2EEY1_9PEZI|nr:glycosyltransferase family 1 protein [Lepidopterella palustris CBS 459.81]